MATKAKTGAKRGSTRADRAKGKQTKQEKESRSGVRVKFEDDYETVIDLDKLTVGETVELEEWLGKPIGEAWADGWMFSAKAGAKIAHIARRREENGFSITEVLAATELDVEFGVVPPTTPETDGSKD